ncbi:hypothetical protein BC938DRAFT_476508, partial [Jimgerdemannia flammicorona]
WGTKHRRYSGWRGIFQRGRGEEGVGVSLSHCVGNMSLFRMPSSCSDAHEVAHSYVTTRDHTEILTDWDNTTLNNFTPCSVLPAKWRRCGAPCSSKSSTTPPASAVRTLSVSFIYPHFHPHLDPNLPSPLSFPHPNGEGRQSACGGGPVDPDGAGWPTTAEDQRGPAN